MREFRVPESPEYTVFDSVGDSVRFALLCLERCPHCGSLRAKSSFVTPEGEPVLWHDLGGWRGPDGRSTLWAEPWNSSSLPSSQAMRRLSTRPFRSSTMSFIAAPSKTTGSVLGLWREWAGRCSSPPPWSMRERLACCGSRPLDAQFGSSKMSRGSKTDGSLEGASPTAAPYPLDVDGRSPGPIFDWSRDETHLILLLSELTLQGLGDFRAELLELCGAFVKAGGFFGSVNHDAYDEAAAAYLEAFEATGCDRFVSDALTIPEAAFLHHHGPHGFLTEGVDFENCVGREHHIGGAQFGDIRYTEPLLNNLYIAGPALFLLERFAKKEGRLGRTVFLDPEGNVIAEV